MFLAFLAPIVIWSSHLPVLLPPFSVSQYVLVEKIAHKQMVLEWGP